MKDMYTPQAGRSKGLSLILDSHSDLVTSSSVTDDIDGFFAVVDGKGQYPMTYRKAYFIRPGHNNIIALKATNVKADVGLKEQTKPEKRMCYFHDEWKLEVHRYNVYLYNPKR